MISINGLVKKYDSALAVDGLNLGIPGGELFGLLKPSSGTIRIDRVKLEQDPIQVKKIIGYISDRPFLYNKLTGWEYLEFVAGLYSLEPAIACDRAEQFFTFFDLQEFAHELIEGYSHGMKQKVIISRALIHKPKVIIVDEALVELDPKGARQVKQLFQDLCENGTTVFMSTHSMGVAEAMYHRVGIIQKGKMIALGTVDQLRSQAEHQHGDLEAVFLKLTDPSSEGGGEQ